MTAHHGSSVERAPTRRGDTSEERRAQGACRDRRHWSSESISVTSTWSARLDRRTGLPRSCNASDGRVTSVAARPRGRVFPTLARRSGGVPGARLAHRSSEGAGSHRCARRVTLTFWRSRSSPKRHVASTRKTQLFELVRRAWPYRALTRQQFDAVVAMLADGFADQARCRRGALIYRDGIHERLRGRRGARMLALTSGGAIPEGCRLSSGARARRHVHWHGERGLRRGDDGGRRDPARKHVVASAAGRRGVMRVADAKGAPPNIPFWLGEAPSRVRRSCRCAVSRPAERYRRKARVGLDECRDGCGRRVGRG